MTATVCLRCPSCHARLKAPAVLLGQWRSCPSCARRFLVRIQAPRDAAPVLVADPPPPCVLPAPSAA